MAGAALFLDHASELGGAEHSLLLLLEQLGPAGWQIHLACPAGSLARRARGLGVRVHELPLQRLRGALPRIDQLASGVIRTARLVRKERIDLICSNTLRASLYGSLAALVARRPHVWYVRDRMDPGTYASFVARASAGVIAVSRFVAAGLPDSANPVVIPNGIVVERFDGDREEARRRQRLAWGIPAEAVLVCQVARLAPWKGQIEVLRAAAALRDHDDIWWVVVGSDIFADQRDYAARVQSLAAELNLSRVRLAGHFSDVTPVLHAADVVVHASHEEPFGRILIEAGAAERPVVAHSSGAVAEVVVHDVTGWLVDGNAVALADGVRRLAADPALRRRLGSRARARVAEAYTASATARAVADVFERALRSAPRTKTGGAIGTR